MKIIAGVDIGNATTETAIGRTHASGEMEFLSSSIAPTTGIKGTRDNLPGIYRSIKEAVDAAGLSLEDLTLIRINEAAPVIGDVAMETITETVITESTMIGHNPHTPGGLGIGVGMARTLDQEEKVSHQEPVILLIPKRVDFEQAARRINALVQKGHLVKAAVCEADDGVLIFNRLKVPIPIVDEVRLFDQIPRGMLTAVEVARPGHVVETLSNPYGIATLFDLDSEQVKYIVPIARALIGNRSAVVIRTPTGDVKEKKIPAGKITFQGEKNTRSVDVDAGAEELMDVQGSCTPIRDIRGEAGTNAGAMLERVRHVMASLTGIGHNEVTIRDLLAVDTISPQSVRGGLAGESSMEHAVGVAAMVKSDKLQMERIAEEMTKQLKVPVVVGGEEAVMAIGGALTTPGTDKPLALLDMGAGSTDASIIDARGKIRAIHLAGAGNMVTLLIQTELGLEDNDLAEDLKKFPLAKAESLFHIRHEDGTVQFFDRPLDPKLFARVLIVKDDELVPVLTPLSIEKVKAVRQNAKKAVFVTNALRALAQVSLTGNMRDIEHVVLVGGSALDFEIPQLVTDALSRSGVVAGRGNIRGTEGPRNAVATGLVLMGEST